MDSLITEVDILEESKDAFLTYAEEVLTDRAVPSAEDGLLSVHRKLLWTMSEILKMSNKSKFKKSASVVGSTLASSYFHGDAACYGALCKIAQPYLMRYPLIDGDGNLGTQEGNGMEAAARYTNCKPSIYADLMMTDFKKNLVPLKETYNGEYMEPVVLPSLLPNAIVNGRETIAIGLAHNSLPNNLTETCDSIIARIRKGEKLTVDELMQYMKGPDFPLENDIINAKAIKEAYRTGKSKESLKVRGKYTIEKDSIIFTTIPYRTYRNKIKEQITKNIDVFDEIFEDFSDESNVGKNKLVFKLKPGVSAETALKKLFSLTDLQTTLSYNMNYIVDGTPKMCSMMDLIDAYVSHQINLLIKSTEYDKAKAEARKHILEGLILIISDIDKAIQLIKSSANKSDAAAALMREYSLSEEQAKAVLDMRLSKLTKLDENELINELKQKNAIIEECNKILTIPSYRDEKLIEKVEMLRDKYGDTRRTNLMDLEIKEDKKEPEIVAAEDVVVVVTENNEVKRVPVKSFKVQRKGGKGVKTSSDAILNTISTNTADYMLFFTSKGKMYRCVVDNIPSGTMASKPVSINSLVPIEAGEKVIAATSLNSKSNCEYVLFFTRNGLIKKTKLEEYTKGRKTTGIQAIKIKDGDSIANVVFANEENVIIVTKNGMSIHFETSNISPIGKITTGVKAIKLDEDDAVVTGILIDDLENNMISVFTEKGYGKRTPIKEFPTQGRGGKGVVIYKPSDITGRLVGAASAKTNDNILLSGNKTICVAVDDVPIVSRVSLGNVLTKDNIISNITII